MSFGLSLKPASFRNDVDKKEKWFGKEFSLSNKVYTKMSDFISVIFSHIIV